MGAGAGWREADRQGGLLAGMEEFRESHVDNGAPGKACCQIGQRSEGQRHPKDGRRRRKAGPCGDEERRQRCRDGSEREEAGARADQRGASTWAVTFASTSAAPRPSISALGESTTRCRIAGRKSRFTSSGIA